MKCQICGYEFVIGDMICERPNDAPGNDTVIICESCSNAHDVFWVED